MPLPSTTILQVRQGAAIIYEQADYASGSMAGYRWKLKKNFMEKQTYSGTITAGAAKRIRQTIDLLLQMSPLTNKLNPVNNRVIKHQLSFITLTIPDETKNYTPKEAYKILLAPFLRYMRDKKIMTTYVWKAELQKRGQLHYHITTPSIIPYQIIKDYWNDLMRKNNMLIDFKNRFGHDNPNSTDIKNVKRINDMKNYLAKEFTKTMQNESATTGKLWDASLNLKGNKYFSVELTSEVGKLILGAHKRDEIWVKDLEQCSIINCKNIKSSSLLTPVQKKQYQEYLASLKRKNEYDKPIKKQKAQPQYDKIYTNDQLTTYILREIADKDKP